MYIIEILNQQAEQKFIGLFQTYQQATDYALNLARETKGMRRYEVHTLNMVNHAS